MAADTCPRIPECAIQGKRGIKCIGRFLDAILGAQKESTQRMRLRIPWRELQPTLQFTASRAKSPEGKL